MPTSSALLFVQDMLFLHAVDENGRSLHITDEHACMHACVCHARPIWMSLWASGQSRGFAMDDAHLSIRVSSDGNEGAFHRQARSCCIDDPNRELGDGCSVTVVSKHVTWPTW